MQNQDMLLFYRKVITWINKHEIFYTNTLLEEMKIQRSEPASLDELRIKNVIIRLRKKDYLMACGKKKKHNQYLVVKIIPVDILEQKKKNES